jgi:hypothetical protein
MIGEGRALWIDVPNDDVFALAVAALVAVLFVGLAVAFIVLT